MKSFFLLCISVLISFSLYSQKMGYYKINGEVTDSVRIMDKNNAKSCKIMNNDRVVKILYPDQIDEYGFYDGRVYIAINVLPKDSEENFFYERIRVKDLIFYYLKKNDGTDGEIFYLEQEDGNLKELHKKGDEPGYINILSNLLLEDCPGVKDNIKIMKYNKSYFDLLFKQYENCKTKPFPYLKYGVTAGYNTKKLKPSDNLLIKPNLDKMTLKTSGEFTVGAFIDIPLFYSDFSVHIELYYSKHDYFYTKYEEKDEVSPAHSVNYDLKTSSIDVPVLVRYTLPFARLRPFVNIGGVYSYYLCWDDEYYCIYEEPADTVGENEWKDVVSYNNHQLGLSFGGGIEYKINYRRSVFFDVRYTKFIDSEIFTRATLKSDMRNRSAVGFSLSVNI